MSNKTVLERLLNEIEKYDKNRNDRDAFAQIVYESIEALEGIPYSVHQQGRDWQYKIETEEYFDKEGFESEINEVIPKLKAWVDELIQSHS
ncbi:hypothetical protein KO533_20515 [Shewanella sp. NKUCC05_KAH]|jgi:hypothetical protein|uniref:hypothetical protein n=1 Tax=Shewanella TaxID=22 RepID=UPI001C5BE22A|nr:MULTISPECIES: hypothetical protein [unclassified Shewanella]MBW3528931.1 hypothetical protein [Shewanella sp. NKUCC05_KAH]MCU8028776.1 hypothetical protein [Shewanella sp. SM73]